MNRRSALKSIGALGLGALLPGSFPSPRAARAARGASPKAPAACWLTPTETEGPYYFDADLVRPDIRTDVDTGTYHDGLPLLMTFTIINANCVPLPNVLVDIWHADKDGVYSGYEQPGGIDTTGQDFMRGIQSTDANGVCHFTTSYPGWYEGRATHIHFKVRLSSTTYLTSQFAFPDGANDSVYQSPLYVARGPNPMSNADDPIFGSSSPQYEVMSIVDNQNGTVGGTFTIGVNAPVGIGEPRPIDASRVSLRLEPASPTARRRSLSFSLPASGRVSLCAYDMLGRKVLTILEGERAAGLETATFEVGSLPSGFYMIKIVAGGTSDDAEILVLR